MWGAGGWLGGYNAGDQLWTETQTGLAGPRGPEHKCLTIRSGFSEEGPF